MTAQRHKAFVCRAVIRLPDGRPAVAIATEDEDLVDDGDTLAAVEPDGRLVAFAKVTLVRAHRARPEWSVLELTKGQSPRRGSQLVAYGST